MNSITKDVKIFLDDLGLFKLPIDLQEICRKLKINYDEHPFDGFEGLLLVEGGNQLIGVSSKILEKSRKLFTCAHELGHYHYDLVADGIFKCNKDDIGYGKQQIGAKEVRANSFASELLLPSEFFFHDIKSAQPSWDVIGKLATKYGTSLQATASRYVNLAPYTCWLVVAKGGKLQRFVKADQNEFLVDLNSPYKSPKTKATDWMTVSADNWLYANRRTKEKELLLWPLPENQYGESLMLVWDEGDSLQEGEFDFDDDGRDEDDDRFSYD